MAATRAAPALTFGRWHKPILPRRNTKEMKMPDYIIIIEKGDGNCSAYCPDLPGVVAAAETEDETIDLIEKP